LEVPPQKGRKHVWNQYVPSRKISHLSVFVTKQNYNANLMSDKSHTSIVFVDNNCKYNVVSKMSSI